MGFIREVDNCEITKHAKHAGNHALDNKYPSPASEPFKTIHLHQPVGQDARACGCKTADNIEDRVSLPYVIPSIPRRQKVHTAWEKPSFQNPENHSKTCEILPIMDESHTDHAGTP